MQPPAKFARLADFNAWNIEPPKPSVPVDLSRSPSLRDNGAPPQSSLASAANLFVRQPPLPMAGGQPQPVFINQPVQPFAQPAPAPQPEPPLKKTDDEFKR